MAACYKCGENIPQGVESTPEAVCTRCSSYLHSCANCHFYDEYQRNPCRQAQAPFVHDRLGKNECSFFRLKSSGPVADERPKKKPLRDDGLQSNWKGRKPRNNNLAPDRDPSRSLEKTQGGFNNKKNSNAKEKLEQLFS